MLEMEMVWLPKVLVDICLVTWSYVTALRTSNSKLNIGQYGFVAKGSEKFLF
jgi:hypothetical protein